MTELITQFFKWAFDLMTGITPLFQWLFTPLAEISSLVGFDVYPMGLIGVGGLTIGVLRAIL